MSCVIYSYFLSACFTDTGGYKKSGVMVEFSDLAYHVRAPGDMTSDQLDEIITFLHNRILTQERTQLYLLEKFHNTLRG